MKHITNPWRQEILVFDTLDSTNRLAKDMAKQGAPEGTVLLAKTQTAGRGRLGRSFFSPPEAGLYLSLVLRPQARIQDLMHLTCSAGVALCQAVQEITGLQPELKWINDLVVQGRKAAGILVEQGLHPGTDRVDWAVVGIGINCTNDSFPPELATVATSLAQAGAKPFLQEDLLQALLERLHALTPLPASQILPLYREKCITLGNEVQILRPNEIRRGKALDVDSRGGLIVQTDTGLETVSAGEVSVRGLYGYIS